MPEYLTPGVYVEEIEIGPKSIQGVGTSTAGFLGIAERGPIRPRLIINFPDFQRLYGDFLEDSNLAYAVEGFFRNGGQRCFIARITHTSTPPTDDIAFKDLAMIGLTPKTVRIKAIGPGSWGNRVYFKIDEASSRRSDLFKLTVLYFTKTNAPKQLSGTTPPFTPDPSHKYSRGLKERKEPAEAGFEIYDDLSTDPRSVDYYKKRINGVSKLISIIDDVLPSEPPTQPPRTTVKVFTWEDVAPGSTDTVALRDFLNWNFHLDWIAGVDPVTPAAPSTIQFTVAGPPPHSATLTRKGNNVKVNIDGKDSYEFFLLPNAAKNDAYTTNIQSLDGIAATDNAITLADYDGITQQVEDPNGMWGNLNVVEATGLRGFKEVDEINNLCAPDEEKIPGLTDALISHCEELKDRFAILQNKRADSYNVGDLKNNRESKYAATYLPWISVFDRLTGNQRLIPPGGHIAGIYARSDIERGVHKAPANELVRGAASLQVQLTREEQGILNPRGINVIRSFPGRGILVWGARTVSTDPLWRYINVRRLFLFIEESIDESTQWLVFEPNNQRLWARVIATITPFLSRLRRDGALMGTTDEEAFFVKCDRTTMTQDDIDNGRLIVVIGVAPVKPAEFVIFRIAQTKSGAEVEEL